MVKIVDRLGEEVMVIWPMISEISTGTNARRQRMHPSVFLAYEFPLPPMETQVFRSC